MDTKTPLHTANPQSTSRRLFSYLIPYWKGVTVATVCMLAVAWMNLIPPWLTKVIIEREGCRSGGCTKAHNRLPLLNRWIQQTVQFGFDSRDKAYD